MNRPCWRFFLPGIQVGRDRVERLDSQSSSSSLLIEPLAVLGVSKDCVRALSLSSLREAFKY